MSNIQKGKELIAILRKIEIRLSLLKKKEQNMTINGLKCSR